MSQRTYIACHQPVSEQHSSPPNSFLDQLIDAINPLQDDVFDENERYDIYSVMLGSLGPYADLLHRKAVMCEVLRVQAAFESDWNWNEGVDINNQHSLSHLDGQETGAFQVSADSMRFDESLSECVDRLAGNHEVLTFINAMKSNHAPAVEYCARLLRFNTKWCGTINNPHMVIAHVRRDAVAEFQTFLQLNPAARAAAAFPPAAAKTPSPVAKADKSCVETVLKLASNVSTLDDAQLRAGRKLLAYDGEVFPHDACAIALSTLLQDGGINVPDIYQAITLGRELRDKRNWQTIPVGQHQAGDIGSTCGDQPDHGRDHIYVVLKKVDDDEMLIADNQQSQPHSRFVSGQGRTPTKFFLRAT